MATVREGDQALLLIVDVQAGVMRECWDSPRIVQNVARVVERARAQGVPVFWVQHADADLVHGTPEWEWADGVRPGPGEPVIAKQFNSAFEQTALEAELAKARATHLVLAGAATNWCIRATAYAALERGYDLTLVRDAHTTGTIEADGVRVEAVHVVDELNAVLGFLSYPGRRCAAVPSAEVAFRP